jgi:DNA-binding MarR family transcriptional regulator
MISRIDAGKHRELHRHHREELVVAGARAQGRLVEKLLAVLAEGPVLDPTGYAPRLLLPKTGYGSAASLSAVLYRLEAAGLVHRETHNKRTFAIELTAAGRARLDPTPEQHPKPEQTTVVSVMPAGPASTWANQSAAKADRSEAEQPTAPSQETPGETGAIDYDVLAGVLLKKALQALQATDNSAEIDRLKALVAKEQDRRRTAETRQAQLEEELADLKGRNFGLDTELRITRQNVETLTKRLELAERRRTDLNPDQAAGLNTLQRELAKIMVQPPGR